jgi:hypothetical protein
MKLKILRKRHWQAMRGSARVSSGRAVIPRVPRGLGGAIQPRPPRRRGVAPLVRSPAPRVRPLEIRAREALLPETPAHKGDAPLANPALAARLAEVPEWKGTETPFPLRARPRFFYRPPP